MTLPTLLIIAAASTFFVGYLIINQVWLRVTLFCGTLLYIFYYMVAADEPLWAAVLTSAATGTANLVGLALLLSRSSKALVPRAHRDIYPLFSRLKPGDFRKVILLADRYTLDTPLIATVEGQHPKALWFVLGGRTTVDKQGEQFALPPHLFIGEVAYILGSVSSATTTVAAGAEVLRWDLDLLARQMKRDTRLRLAVDAMVSHDMARKIAHAVPIESMRNGTFPFGPPT